MVERRKFKRFFASLGAEVQAIGGGESSVSGEIVDFSRDGLRLALPSPIACEPGGVMQIKTYLPNQHLPIVFEGRARWAQEAGQMYEIGCRLETIAPSDKSDILQYAYSRWRQAQFP